MSFVGRIDKLRKIPGSGMKGKKRIFVEYVILTFAPLINFYKAIADLTGVFEILSNSKKCRKLIKRK